MEIINKIRGLKSSTTTMRARKTIKEEDYCSECKNYFRKNLLDIEHEIPVSIGGNPYDFRFFCKSCHNKKTNIDIKIINFFKKTNLLIKHNSESFETPLTKEELIQTYKILFLLIKKGELYNEDK